MKKRTVIGLFVAAFLALPAMVWANNSNPLCDLVPKYSLEWYVMFCNYTEIPNPPEG